MPRVFAEPTAGLAGKSSVKLGNMIGKILSAGERTQVRAVVSTKWFYFVAAVVAGAGAGATCCPPRLSLAGVERSVITFNEHQIHVAGFELAVFRVGTEREALAAAGGT